MTFVLVRNKIIGVNILYYPINFHILQEFYWETPDVVPGMPRINRFLKFWKEHIKAIIANIEYIEKDNAHWRREI